jgi:DNA invertase Pin-like site-specific DNA recombinase
MSKVETRVSTLEKRAEQHDRQIAAVRALLIQGAKLVVVIGRQQKENEKALNRLIRSLERGGANGHSNGRKKQ